MSVPKIRFPGFKNNWITASLGTVGKITTGNTPPTKDASLYGGDIPFYGPADFPAESGNLCEASKTLTALGYVASRKVKTGDTAVVCIGTVGKVAYVSKDGSFNQQINSISPNGDVNSYFLYLATLRYSDNIKAISSKTTIPMVNKSEFSKFTIAIPCLSEQRRIANTLSAVDTKIDLLVRKRDNLACFKAGLMQKIFSQEVRFTRENGSAYPDWEENKIGDISAVLKGNGIAKSDISEEGKIACVQYGDLFRNYGEIISKTLTRTNNPGSVYSSYGDILMPDADVTPMGLGRGSVVVSEGVSLGYHINIIRPASGNNPAFLCLAINSRQREFQKRVVGTTIKMLYPSEVSKVSIPTPSLPEQNKIAEFFAVLDERINATSSQISAIQTFKKGLLQQMFV